MSWEGPCARRSPDQWAASGRGGGRGIGGRARSPVAWRATGHVPVATPGITPGLGSGREAKSHSGGPSEVSGDECRVLTDSLDLSKGAVECVGREQSMIMKSDDVRSGSEFALILDV